MENKAFDLSDITLPENLDDILEHLMSDLAGTEIYWDPLATSRSTSTSLEAGTTLEDGSQTGVTLAEAGAMEFPSMSSSVSTSWCEHQPSSDDYSQLLQDTSSQTLSSHYERLSSLSDQRRTDLEVLHQNTPQVFSKNPYPVSTLPVQSTGAVRKEKMMKTKQSFAKVPKYTKDNLTSQETFLSEPLSFQQHDPSNPSPSSSFSHGTVTSSQSDACDANLPAQVQLQRLFPSFAGARDNTILQPSGYDQSQSFGSLFKDPCNSSQFTLGNELTYATTTPSTSLDPTTDDLRFSSQNFLTTEVPLSHTEHSYLSQPNPKDINKSQGPLDPEVSREMEDILSQPHSNLEQKYNEMRYQNNISSSRYRKNKSERNKRTRLELEELQKENERLTIKEAALQKLCDEMKEYLVPFYQKYIKNKKPE